MPDVFGIEGPSGSPEKKPGPSKKPASRGEPDMLYGSQDPRQGEGPRNKFTQFDNLTGEILVDLPPDMAKHRRELEEELMDEFAGEPGGGASLETWIRDWIDRKRREDEEAGSPPLE